MRVCRPNVTRSRSRTPVATKNLVRIGTIDVGPPLISSHSYTGIRRSRTFWLGGCPFTCLPKEMDTSHFPSGEGCANQLG